MHRNTAKSLPSAFLQRAVNLQQTNYLQILTCAALVMAGRLPTPAFFPLIWQEPSSSPRISSAAARAPL
jgi:hypothetical protein